MWFSYWIFLKRIYIYDFFLKNDKLDDNFVNSLYNSFLYIWVSLAVSRFSGNICWDKVSKGKI